MPTISVNHWNDLVKGWEHEDERAARVRDVFELVASAVRANDWTMLASLLRRGASSQTVFNGMTPLFIAVESGAVECARLLLETGASPSWADSKGSCALMLAVSLRADEMIDLLLSKGANPSRRDKTRRTPLILSAIHGHFYSAKAFVDLGVDVDERDSGGQTALHHVLKKREPSGDDVAIARLLLGEGANPEKRDLSGRRPLDVVGHEQFLSALEAAQLEAAVAPEPEAAPSSDNDASPGAAPAEPETTFGVRRRRPRL